MLGKSINVGCELVSCSAMSMIQQHMRGCTALTSNTMRWSSVLMTPLRLGKMVNDDAFACFASTRS